MACAKVVLDNNPLILEATLSTTRSFQSFSKMSAGTNFFVFA
jgi:hypothetical protein